MEVTVGCDRGQASDIRTIPAAGTRRSRSAEEQRDERQVKLDECQGTLRELQATCDRLHRELEDGKRNDRESGRSGLQAEVERLSPSCRVVEQARTARDEAAQVKPLQAERMHCSDSWERQDSKGPRCLKRPRRRSRSERNATSCCKQWARPGGKPRNLRRPRRNWRRCVPKRSHFASSSRKLSNATKRCPKPWRKLNPRTECHTLREQLSAPSNAANSSRSPRINMRRCGRNARLFANSC